MPTHFQSLLLAVFLCILVIFGQNSQPAPVQLKTEIKSNELGLALNEIAFSWQAPGQQSFQILVASDERKLALDIGDLWDSGRRYTQVQEGVRYEGNALTSGATIWWKVRTWTDDASPGGYSEAMSFDVPATEQARNRIAFLGGSLISRMEKFGYLETAITAHWPMHDITFRNLGWPADDVLGTARGEFGSLRNTRSWRPPTEEEGVAYQVMMEHVSDAGATSLIVGYGNEAAFLDTDEAFEVFKTNYQKLIVDLNDTEATLILLTPTPHCQTNIMEDPDENNGRLAKAAAFINEYGASEGYRSIDLFNHFKSKACTGEQGLYDVNGIHLNDAGYQEMARFVTQELGIPAGNIDVSIDIDGHISTADGARLQNAVKIKKGVRFDVRADKLLAPWEEGSFKVAPGDIPQQLKINGAVLAEYADAFTSSPSHKQFENLRQIVVEKNKFHRDKMRPLNLAYIYLFRRHEMGHLAHESEDLDMHVEGHEQVIANLRQPGTHRYEVKQVDDWKAPRDYPDHEVPQDVPEPNIAEELKAFTLADGLEISLFSDDPLIANPINLNWDTRGRAWIATSSTYPHLKPGDHSNDRIVILEDWNQDGVADTAKVFAEGFLVPHSVMPVEGGAFVASTTELYFLADHDGDDVADEQRIVYAGFGNADVHHMIHGFRWAPWGDLHFTQSIYINSFIDTAFGPRRLNGSGVWYFRPEEERLEIYSRGMTNPWGFAFDAWGQSFATDGAGGAGPHYAFPGAKHPTAVGAHRVLPGLIPGKPKNTAAEFVSGRHMPEEWVGTMLANDYRANRMIRYAMTENGSGFTAEEVQTVLHSSHRSFRPVDIKMGPDGAAYIVDWYNPIIDHGEVDFYHPLRDRSHGRIWRLTAKDRPLVPHPEIEGATIAQLFELLKAPEQYTREQANRALVRRPANQIAKYIKKWVQELDPAEPGYEHHRLEAGWLSLAINVPDLELIDDLLSSPSAETRAAAARMLGKTVNISDNLAHALQGLEKAVQDQHPRVRLEAVNALRMLNSPESVTLALRALDLPVDNNLSFALELTVRDSREQWVPAMLAGKSVFDGNKDRLRFALLEVTDSRVTGALLDLVEEGALDADDLSVAIQRISSLGNEEEVARVLKQARANPELLIDIAESATVNSASPTNAGDLSVYFANKDANVRKAAIELAGIWQLDAMVPQMVELAETATNPDERQAATDALAQLAAMDALQQLMNPENKSGLRASAVAAWGTIAPDAAAPVALDMLASMEDKEGISAIIRAFISTEEGLSAFKTTLEASTLPELAAIEGIRAVRASGRYMGDLIEAFNKAGGLDNISQDMSPAQRTALLLDASEAGDASRGRFIYRQNNLQCNNCHLVDGEGKDFGPDLSSLGAYMTPASILESLLNPNTDIKQGYETILVRKKDNSIVSGLLQRETGDAMLVKMPGGAMVAIPNDEIEKIENSAFSLMPAGLTGALRRDELLDLLKYLTELGQE